jgi:methylglutaconyl-CoA hydratase
LHVTQAAPETFVERSDDGRVSSIVLNRGRKRNALSPAIIQAFHALLREVEADASRVVLIRSAVPGIFCAGFDISYFGSDEHQAGEENLRRLMSAIERCPKPVVAFTDGVAAGAGVELLTACDLRLGTAAATFRLPPAKLSLVYPFEGMARLMRIVGATAATDMLLSGRVLSAAEAWNCGLLSLVVADHAAAADYCGQVADGAPKALQAMKLMLRALAKAGSLDRIDPKDRAEAEALSKAVDDGDDRKEALEAFTKKRPPIFTGR